MIHNDITYYKEGELQRGECAICGRTRDDIIIKEGVCIDCYEQKEESIERIIKIIIH